MNYYCTFVTLALFCSVEVAEGTVNCLFEDLFGNIVGLEFKNKEKRKLMVYNYNYELILCIIIAITLFLYLKDS